MGGCCGAMKTGQKSLPDKRKSTEQGNQEKSNGKESVAQALLTNEAAKTPIPEVKEGARIEDAAEGNIQEQIIATSVKVSLNSTEPVEDSVAAPENVMDLETAVAPFDSLIANEPADQQLESMTTTQEIISSTDPETLLFYQIPVQHTFTTGHQESKEEVQLRVKEPQSDDASPGDQQLSVTKQSLAISVKESLNEVSPIPADVAVQPAVVPKAERISAPNAHFELKAKADSGFEKPVIHDERSDLDAYFQLEPTSKVTEDLKQNVSAETEEPSLPVDQVDVAIESREKPERTPIVCSGRNKPDIPLAGNAAVCPPSTAGFSAENDKIAVCPPFEEDVIAADDYHQELEEQIAASSAPLQETATPLLREDTALPVEDGRIQQSVDKSAEAITQVLGFKQAHATQAGSFDQVITNVEISPKLVEEPALVPPQEIKRNDDDAIETGQQLLTDTAVDQQTVSVCAPPSEVSVAESSQPEVLSASEVNDIRQIRRLSQGTEVVPLVSVGPAHEFGQHEAPMHSAPAEAPTESSMIEENARSSQSEEIIDSEFVTEQFRPPAGKNRVVDVVDAVPSQLQRIPSKEQLSYQQQPPEESVPDQKYQPEEPLLTQERQQPDEPAAVQEQQPQEQLSSQEQQHPDEPAAVQKQQSKVPLPPQEQQPDEPEDCQKRQPDETVAVQEQQPKELLPPQEQQTGESAAVQKQQQQQPYEPLSAHMQQTEEQVSIQEQLEKPISNQENQEPVPVQERQVRDQHVEESSLVEQVPTSPDDLGSTGNFETLSTLERVTVQVQDSRDEWWKESGVDEQVPVLQLVANQSQEARQSWWKQGGSATSTQSQPEDPTISSTQEEFQPESVSQLEFSCADQVATVSRSETVPEESLAEDLVSAEAEILSSPISDSFPEVIPEPLAYAGGQHFHETTNSAVQFPVSPDVNVIPTESGGDVTQSSSDEAFTPASVLSPDESTTPVSAILSPEGVDPAATAAVEPISTQA